MLSRSDGMNDGLRVWSIVRFDHCWRRKRRRRIEKKREVGTFRYGNEFRHQAIEWNGMEWNRRRDIPTFAS